MRLFSIYVFECVCGSQVESAATVAACRSCGRILVVELYSEIQPSSGGAVEADGPHGDTIGASALAAV